MRWLREVREGMSAAVIDIVERSTAQEGFEEKEVVRLSLDCRAVLSVFGLVQYSICLVGNAVFLYSAACRHIWRQQSLLQPLLRARAALRPAGRKIEAVQKCGAAKVF